MSLTPCTVHWLICVRLTFKRDTASSLSHQGSLLHLLKNIFTGSVGEILMNLKQCGVRCPFNSFKPIHAFTSLTSVIWTTLGLGVVLSAVSLSNSVDNRYHKLSWFFNNIPLNWSSWDWHSGNNHVSKVSWNYVLTCKALCSMLLQTMRHLWEELVHIFVGVSDWQEVKFYL